MLTFQRLDVYRCSIELLALFPPLLDGLPRGTAALADQLRRAAMSVPLDIAEAEGRTGGADKARTYAIARGSAMECAAILDVYKTLGIIEESVGVIHHPVVGRGLVPRPMDNPWKPLVRPGTSPDPTVLVTGK